MLQGAAFRILACFYDTNTYGFVELCKRAGYPTDLGGYYIRQLMRGGYLEKVERGQYQILPSGKQQLAFYYGKRLLAPRPRLSVLIVAKQDDKFIVTHRKVQPFIDVVEWPAGTVSMGEDLQSASVRIIRDRLGITGQTRFVGMFRRVDHYADTVFDDKLFAVYRCELSKEVSLHTTSEAGNNLAYTLEGLKTLSNLSKALFDILAFVNRGSSALEEHTYQLGPTDLSLDVKAS